MEFVYKEVTRDSTTTKGKKKKGSATEAQKLQRAADAGLWTRVYERYRYRGKHCKQGPHCWPDEQGNHRKLLPAQLEDIFCHIKRNIKEGEREEDVDVDIKIPPYILKDVLDNSRKRKADGSIDFRQCKAYVSAYGRCCDTAERIPGEDHKDVKGDRQAKLKEYCNQSLARVESDRWRNALHIANQVAINHFLELNTILQHSEVVADLMEKKGVAPGITLQFVSNIKKFQRQEKES